MVDELRHLFPVHVGHGELPAEDRAARQEPLLRVERGVLEDAPGEIVPYALPDRRT
jgi:hypothetical protein